MRTRTGCCGSTSRKGRTWPRTAPMTSRPWQRRSTQGRARRSAGERQPKLLMRCCDQRRQVLRRPVEAKQRDRSAVMEATLADVRPTALQVHGHEKAEDVAWPEPDMAMFKPH